MEKLDELRDELKHMREYHMSSWNIYGSELCAGEMLRKEKELENKIKELEKNK